MRRVSVFLCSACRRPMRRARNKFCSQECYRSSRSRTVSERFWPFVAVGGDDECWEWQGGTVHGYGVFKCILHGARYFRAHRVSWALRNGPIPGEQMVCHDCDNRLCVNPGHLFIGSARDNIRDMWNKGREYRPPVAVGERNKASKLTAGAVSEIRDRHAQGEPVASLAREFHVERVSIRRVVQRETWAHVN